MEIFAVIAGIYFWGAVLIAWPYFWFKRTNRSMSPLERRLRAMVLGFGWPYFVYWHFAGRSAAETAEQERQEAAARIIGGGSDLPAQRGPAPATPTRQAPPAAAPGSSGSKISNPFDSL